MSPFKCGGCLCCEFQEFGRAGKVLHFFVDAVMQIPHSYIAFAPICFEDYSIGRNQARADNKITRKEIETVRTTTTIVENGRRVIALNNCLSRSRCIGHANPTTAE